MRLLLQVAVVPFCDVPIGQVVIAGEYPTAPVPKVGHLQPIGHTVVNLHISGEVPECGLGVDFFCALPVLA